MTSVEELRNLQIEVLTKSCQILNEYFTEAKDKQNKKILAQKILMETNVIEGGRVAHHKLRFEIFKRDDFKCVYCGRGAKEVVLEIDHVNPCALGGNSNIENLVTACKDCNIGKRDFLLNENQEQKFISQNRKLSGG